MTIVSDTSPLSYLVLIGVEDVLPTLYGQILIPKTVHRELEHPRGPETIRDWIKTAPSWLGVREVESTGETRVSDSEAGDLQSLDPGERKAIVLAKQRDAEFLLIDERAGRRIARAHGVPVTGTIGVLGAAAKKGHVDAARVTKALRETSFRASPDLYRWLLSMQE